MFLNRQVVSQFGHDNTFVRLVSPIDVERI
jgi:hypothetical protein|nr:MAG TPA: hypothetical protein [Caudoviricetes sp.]